MARKKSPFELVGTKESEIEVKISNRIVELFSEGLYSSPNKAIEELVSNSFDAGAHNVHVILPPDVDQPGTTIVVVDDGSGMDGGGLQQHWIIGSSKKRLRVVGDRNPIGKFGIGKLATYVLAAKLTHISKVKRRFYAATMDYELIQDGTNDEVFSEETVHLPLRSLSEAQARSALAPWTTGTTAGHKALRLFGRSARQSHYEHFLPFYFHLILATIVITSSWVGWSLSQAPGARRDVTGVFTWGFATLLLDVFLVVLYFIMVRTIELGKAADTPRIESPEKYAGLIVGMFALFLIWDFVTKVFAYLHSNDEPWLHNCGLRMIPTCVCLFVAIVVYCLLDKVDLVHYINADLALLALALLFRSLKDAISEKFPRLIKSTEDASLFIPQRAVDKGKVNRAIFWSVVCFFGVILGTASAKYSWPLLPSHVVQQITSPVSPERPGDLATPKPVRAERDTSNE